MKYEVYCDESQQDVFWSKSAQRATHLMIGSLWLPADKREEIKDAMRELRGRHGFSREIKWTSITARYEEFFCQLVDLFMAQGEDLRFRCIAVEGAKVDLFRFHEADAELGFYKFYYQLLKHWILDCNEYRFFCDEKTTRVGDHLKTLRRTLSCSNYAASVVSVQALPSKEVAIIQLCDLLLGAASARTNAGLWDGSAKERVVLHLERRLGRSICPTRKSEQKFNVFKINLQGE